MLHFKPSNQQGFTLFELVIAMAIATTISITLYVFFNATMSNYFASQKDATNFSELADQSQRIAKVLRGITDFTSVAANDASMYSYFSPNDQYVSLIHYYTDANKKKLLADVTRMSSNPPVGTPVAGSTTTFTIISNFYQPAGTDLFTYLDSDGSALSLPIADQHTIKGVKINLAALTNTTSGNQSLSLQVSLRNRKTNL